MATPRRYPSASWQSDDLWSGIGGFRYCCYACLSPCDKFKVQQVPAKQALQASLLSYAENV